MRFAYACLWSVAATLVLSAGVMAQQRPLVLAYYYTWYGAPPRCLRPLRALGR